MIGFLVGTLATNTILSSFSEGAMLAASVFLVSRGVKSGKRRR